MIKMEGYVGNDIPFFYARKYSKSPECRSAPSVRSVKSVRSITRITEYVYFGGLFFKRQLHNKIRAVLCL